MHLISMDVLWRFPVCTSLDFPQRRSWKYSWKNIGSSLEHGLEDPPPGGLHIQGLFKTCVLGVRGNGGLKALQVTAQNMILARSINLGNYPCRVKIPFRNVIDIYSDLGSWPHLTWHNKLSMAEDVLDTTRFGAMIGPVPYAKGI